VSGSQKRNPITPEKRRQYYEAKKPRRAERRDQENEQRRRKYAANEATRKARLAANKRWRDANPEKQTAERKLNRAVKAGLVVKPEACGRCGRSPVEAHHPDYSEPLVVLWLCRFCHRTEEKA
jgi:ribosomal protein S27AE